MNKPIFCRCVRCDATFNFYHRDEHDCRAEAE